MIFLELGQAMWAQLPHTQVTLDAVTRQLGQLAPAPKEINTEGIVTFLATKVAPILLGVLGVIFISRASKGEVSRVLTSSAIAIIGLAFIAGAASLFFVGDYLIGLAFK